MLSAFFSVQQHLLGHRSLKCWDWLEKEMLGSATSGVLMYREALVVEWLLMYRRTPASAVI